MMSDQEQRPSQQMLFGSNSSDNTTSIKSNSDAKLEFVLQSLFSNDAIKMKTDINKKQAVLLARAETFCAQYKQPKAMRTFVDELVVYLVSNQRKGRGEMVDSLRSAVSDSELSLKDKLLGSD